MCAIALPLTMTATLASSVRPANVHGWAASRASRRAQQTWRYRRALPTGECPWSLTTHSVSYLPSTRRARRPRECAAPFRRRPHRPCTAGESRPRRVRRLVDPGECGERVARPLLRECASRHLGPTRDRWRASRRRRRVKCVRAGAHGEAEAAAERESLRESARDDAERAERGLASSKIVGCVGSRSLSTCRSPTPT